MRVTKEPYLEHEGMLAFAHRGGDRVAPENTMAAFADAVAQGYRYLETDVHASLDGEVYAFHDNDLSRMVGMDVAINQLPAAEIDALTLSGGHKIPRMVALLDAFPEARFNIDAKSAAVTEPLARLINHTACHERVCIGAFSDARIEAVLRLSDKPLCHSVGPKRASQFMLSVWGGWRPRFNAACLQFPISRYGVAMVTPRSIAHAHRLGLQVHVWTINNESEMHRLLDIGVDGIMTDDCALLKKVLIERDFWA